MAQTAQTVIDTPASSAACTQKVQSNELWWKQAVVYQIYPRSFKDTTGSGLGDIAGVTEQMGYLKKLGVDAIWLSPFYPSELADGGYDVADYRNVDPRLGTIDDFDAMAEAAHKAGLKIVVDIVPNHCSRMHPWFQAALKAAPGSPERARFIFREGRGEHGELPPTNWIDNFGGVAWTRVPDGQWYLHMFTEQQPDWNWDNPEVREDFLKTLRFWCDHGADGFRVDVAHALVKDLDRDDLDKWSIDACHFLPSDGSHPVYDRDGVHEVYREWRKVFNEYDPPRFAVAEAWVNPDRQYLYSSTDELGQTFNFEFAKQVWARGPLHDAIENGLEQAKRAGSTSTWVLNNHDLIRSASRYALAQVPAEHGLYHAFAKDWVLHDGVPYREDRDKGARRSRAALMLEMGLPGSAYVYQGEELGLFEVPDIPWDRLEDPWAVHTSGAASTKGRDGCRVPLPWVAADEPVPDEVADDAAGAKPVFGHADERLGRGTFGFSPIRDDDGGSNTGDVAPLAQPHLPQPLWYKDFAVDVEDAEASSMLNFYRRVLALRRELLGDDTSFAWLDGIDRASGKPDGADGNEGGVIAYVRPGGWASITNFSYDPVALPEGEILLASGPLTEEGLLPQDTTVWMRLA